MAKKPGQTMTGRQKNKFEEILAQLASATGANVEELKVKADVDGIYTDTDRAFEMQSVLNFYQARIEPFLESWKENGRIVKEKPEDFDKRFAEWKFKICSGCGDRFAYAFHYDGVGCCSLECLEQALLKIGLVYSRHKDLKRRWGYFFHPAIVPATALEALERLYSDSAPAAFEHEDLGHPNNQILDTQSQNSNTG